MREEIKARLIRHLRFFEQELKDYSLFKDITWRAYHTDRSRRRDVERWIENLVTSTIDMSKLILVTENIPIPETYREIVHSTALIEDFGETQAEKLSKWVNLRNIVTHEYLDIRWASISKFVSETEPLYQYFLSQIRAYLQNHLGSSEK